MRILSGADYFGQRIAKVYPTDDAESMRTMIRSKGGYERNLHDIQSELAQGQAVAGEVSKVGNILTNIGLEEIAHKDRMETIEFVKQQGKLKKAQQEKDHSELQSKIINYKTNIADTARGVFDDPDIPDDQKLSKFEEAAGALKESTAGDFGDRAHVLEPLHAEAMFNAKQALAKHQEQKLKDQTMANISSSVDTLEQMAGRSPQDRINAIGMLEVMDWSVIPADHAQKIKQGFREKTAINEILDRLNTKDYTNTLKDLTAKDDNGNYTYLTDLDVKDREHLIGSIQSDIAQEKKRIETERKATLREWKSDTRDLLNDYKEAKLAGLPVSPKEELQLYKRVKGTQFEDKFNNIKSTAESFAFVTEKLSKDPLTFGAAKMGIEVPALNMSDPNALMQQLQGRKAVASRVQAANNLNYLPILKTDEVKGIADLMKTQGTGSVQTIQQLMNVMGKDAMMGIAQQVAAEDAQSGMVIAMTASGKASTAKSIYEGNKFLKDKTLKLPKEEDFRGQFDKLAKDSLLGLPENSGAYYEAFKSYYVSQAARKGLTDGIVDKDIAKDAFRQIVGDVTKINGKRVIIPENYDEDRFKNSIKLISQNTVAAAGGALNMSDEDAASVIKGDGQWYSTSRPNVFRIAVDGKYLLTRDGKKYLEFKF